MMGRVFHQAVMNRKRDCGTIDLVVVASFNSIQHSGHSGGFLHQNFYFVPITIRNSLCELVLAIACKEVLDGTQGCAGEAHLDDTNYMG
jgi:hypothetical protein